jgi:hypothetical protein
MVSRAFSRMRLHPPLTDLDHPTQLRYFLTCFSSNVRKMAYVISRCGGKISTGATRKNRLDPSIQPAGVGFFIL